MLLEFRNEKTFSRNAYYCASITYLSFLIILERTPIGMKTSILFLLVAFNTTAQFMPVTNLTYEQQYDFGYYHYALNWEAPSPPHNELLGYNIYRDNEFYRFQTEIGLTTMGPNPNGNQDFMNFESGGDGFEVHVTAIYNPDGQESDYIQTVLVQNNLLHVAGFQKQRLHFYPNPARGILIIVKDDARRIQLYDLSGRLIVTFPIHNQIDISAVAAGIYLLELVYDDKTVCEKLIIE